LTITLLAPVPWVILLFQFLLIVPRHRKLFAQLGLRVPPATQIVLDVSAWVTKHLVLAFLATVVAMGVTVGLAQAVQTERVSRRTRYLVLSLAFGVPCLLFVLAWLGVDVAHRRLEEGLSK
jgi:type II secretory pathway component PulF